MRNVPADSGRSTMHSVESHPTAPDVGISRDRPLVSVVVPAYNEAEILPTNLAELCDYLTQLEDMYQWEVIIVNDGSTDDTGALAETFAKHRPNVRVLHHRTNFRLGQALRYAFNNCRGEYVVTIDCDLSYGPEHIGRLVTELRSTNAKIVIASPYAKNGHTTNIPFFRRFLSRTANRFLAATARGHLSTLTGMVRAYDRRFLSTLNLRAMGTDINTEILYKAELLGAKVVEIPAHLDWTFSQSNGKRRPLAECACQQHQWLPRLRVHVPPGRLLHRSRARRAHGRPLHACLGLVSRGRDLLATDQWQPECEDYHRHPFLLRSRPI